MPDTRRILIVDDSNEQIVYYSEILEAGGYEFMVAKDGREAMDILKTNTPHLVLLDVIMPRKSGIAVFQQMKRDPNLEKIPIIMITGASEVTGVDMKSGEERPKETYQDDMSREFGSMLREKLQGLTPDGFIEKPVEPAVLIAKIESLLG